MTTKSSFLGSASTALVVVFVCFAFLTLGRSDVLIARGSDSLTVIYRPPLWSQITAVLALACAIALTGNLPTWTRTILIAGGIIIVMMSNHLIAVSGLSGDIQEAVSILKIRRLPYESFDRSRPLLSRSGALFVRFDNGKQVAHIFIGLPPWQLDAAALIRHPILNPPSTG